MPVSKKLATSEELPPQARPVLVTLGLAYYEWFLQNHNPDRPKAVALEGCLNDDGTLPQFPALDVFSGELVSREALHRYLTVSGRKSAYNFGPTNSAQAASSPEPAALVALPEQPLAAEPTPVVADSASTIQDPERRLARLRALGGNVTYRRGEWKVAGISALVTIEKSEGRKRSDEKTIRADLKEAAENEREAKRANAFAGLGQR